MHHDIGGLFKYFLRIAGNLHAPGRVARTDHFSQIAANLCRFSVDCSDNFDRLVFSHQLRDGGADGANSVLNGAYFLFHLDPLPLRCSVTPRIFVAKETSKIKDSRRTRNAALLLPIHSWLSHSNARSMEKSAWNNCTYQNWEAFYESAQTR